MKRQRIIVIVLVSLMTGVFSGCLWAPGLDRVRKEIETQLPGARFDRQFALSLGPVSLGLAKTIVRLVPGTEEAREYLKDVSSIKLAVYEGANIPDRSRLETPRQLADMVKNDGWEIAVHANQDDEAVWLLYRSDGDVLRDIYIVALTDDQLVLVTAHGNIDELLVKAVRNRRFARHVPRGEP